MKKLHLVAIFLISLAFVIPSYSEAPSDGIQLLFVQTSDGVAFADGTMTLKGVSRSTVFFSDRPNRIAGQVPTQHFLKIWDEGKDNFKSDPPNANLSILGKTEGATNIVVEITNPRINGNDLIYDVRVLEGNPPATGGASSLFIDWWVGPRGAVCHYGWYSNHTYCHWPGQWGEWPAHPGPRYY
jgi:hypothetical protein